MVYAYTDSTRIRQIIHNILSNAVKFTKIGSVSIDIVVLSGVLDITIADTGIGMTEEDLMVLYEPYVQADSSISSSMVELVWV